MSTMNVNNKKQLREALQNKVDIINIMDDDLAKHIVTVKKSSKAALVAALGTAGAAGTAATMWWNPVGWGAGASALIGTAVMGTVSAALVAAIVVLLAGMTVALLWSLWADYDYKEYEFEAGTLGAKAKVKIKLVRKH